MKKILFLFMCMFHIGLHAQDDSKGVFVSSDNSMTILEKPGIRNIAGGTVINVEYVGNGFNDKIKGAFEHACRLWEEKIPTTFPIKLSVKFSNISNSQCLATVNVINSDTYSGYDKVYDKRFGQIKHFWNCPSIEYIRDEPDAIITFTSRKVFDYNINGSEIADGKYDFVTVAIQAIGKAVGFMCTATHTDEQSFEMLTPCNHFTSVILSNDATKNYQYATSDNAFIKQWKLHSPADFDNRFSLSYFQKDPSNTETLFMQPGIAKGSVIRYIGKSIDDFFDKCGWNDYEIATSISGSSSKIITPASTEHVIPFQGTQTNNVPKKVPSMIYSEDSELVDYIYNMAELGTEGNFILMKDGSWKKFDNYGDFSEKENYARTSDGYVRLKHVYYSYGPSGPSGYYNAYADYQLYDFPPQVPEASMNSYTRSTEFNSPQKIKEQSLSFNATDNEYLDVEIGFKNTEGCEAILVEQTNSNYQVPFTYFVDVNQGYFTAFMNRKYTSTFKLTYYNENGMNEGEPFTIDLRNKFSHKLDLDLVVTDNALKYEFKGDKLVDNISYTLTSIDKYTIVNKGNLLNTTGSIDISNIPKGTYVFTINANGETYSSKFVK